MSLNRGDIFNIRTPSRVLQRLQVLQSEEAALSQEIAAEQGRWSEINQRLEELDRALSRK
jgi:hypothetical protein